MFDHVNLLPWIGAHYSESQVRILFVGMKMYSADPLSVGENATTECVNYYLNDDEYERYFASFDRFIEVVKNDTDSPKEAWGKVAFYNYTQDVLPDSKSRPTSEQIEASKEAYIEVLLQLRPHKVIFWGKWIYDQVLVGYGKEAQRFFGQQTWMVDIHELDSSLPDNDHCFHVTYIDDPSNSSFSISKNRRVISAFLDSQAQPYNSPHYKRRIEQLLRALQIDVEGFTYNDLDFSDVLSKAMVSGLLRFEPEEGVINDQRLTAGSSFASSYFAYCLREKCRATLHDNGLSSQQLLSELINDEKFNMTLSDDGHEIHFRGTKSKTRVKQLFEKLSLLRHGTEKQIEWKVLETLFDIKNLRQNSKHIGHNKDYAKAIDSFFDIND